MSMNDELTDISSKIEALRGLIVKILEALQRIYTAALELQISSLKEPFSEQSSVL